MYVLVDVWSEISNRARRRLRLKRRLHVRPLACSKQTVQNTHDGSKPANTPQTVLFDFSDESAIVMRSSTALLQTQIEQRKISHCFGSR